jgi:hypothetical protein
MSSLAGAPQGFAPTPVTPSHVIVSGQSAKTGAESRSTTPAQSSAACCRAPPPLTSHHRPPAAASRPQAGRRPSPRAAARRRVPPPVAACRRPSPRAAGFAAPVADRQCHPPAPSRYGLRSAPNASGQVVRRRPPPPQPAAATRRPLSAPPMADGRHCCVAGLGRCRVPRAGSSGCVSVSQQECRPRGCPHPIVSTSRRHRSVPTLSTEVHRRSQVVIPSGGQPSRPFPTDVDDPWGNRCGQTRTVTELPTACGRVWISC